ncbi:hypothetical protein GCM10011380_00700 [Sphingomonas metalli]|uniref:Bacteriophage tail tape measure N-terminal domain-containing protein n=1 Tax=Sphingomonas metalli TaxID=1779358 RepID=A0A916STJ4_9SPHN|nr:phage tail length tape measure family protein [Sphingomonas metalli]GGB15142.1 hypothetical protein GCM10011380_00700 [Sphingomonas metalli]
MAETADRVVIELVAKTDGYTAAITGAASTTEAAMSKTEASAAKAEAAIQKAAEKKAAAEEKAAARIAEAAEKARLRVEEAAQKAALRAEAAAQTKADREAAAAQRAAEAAERAAQKQSAAAERAKAAAEKAAAKKGDAEEAAAARAQGAADKAAQREQAAAERAAQAAARAAERKASAEEIAAQRQVAAQEKARQQEEARAKRTADEVAREAARKANAEDIAATKAAQSVEKASARAGNAQRNLGRQISDIGVGLAGGQSPFLTLAQQAPQVADALADTGGRAARVATFFAGPWGAALLAAGSIAGVLAEKLFSLKAAHDETKKAAEATAEAEQILQGVLGGTVNQTERARVASLAKAQAMTLEARATLNNAQAQLTLARAYASAAAATERAAPGGLGIPGRGAASTSVNARQSQLELDQAQIALNAAEIRLRNLEKAATGARAAEAKKDSDKQAREDAAAKRKAEAAARKAEREAEKQAREQAQFVGQRLRGQAELAAAEADLTSDTRLQDQAARLRIIAERDAAKAAIKADPDRSSAQKAELSGIEDRIASARIRLVNINEAQRFLDETLALQKADLTNQTDLVNEQGNLAETKGERRAAAVRLLDLAFERERLELEAVLASKKSTEVEKAIAQKRLDQLGTLYGMRREGAERQYEGAAARYQRDIRAVGQDLKEAYDGVAVDGLQALNGQLADAIVNSKNLGDVFHNVAKQIIADLLRIAIQQSIIKPLATALFSGGNSGGGIAATLASVFGRASGGYVGPGQTVRVNEQSGGMELLRMDSQGGTVIPLGQTRAERPQQIVQNMTTIRVELSDDLNARIDGRSAAAAVEVVRQAAPTIVDAATASTVDRLRRPML